MIREVIEKLNENHGQDGRFSSAPAPAGAKNQIQDWMKYAAESPNDVKIPDDIVEGFTLKSAAARFVKALGGLLKFNEHHDAFGRFCTAEQTTAYSDLKRKDAEAALNEAGWKKLGTAVHPAAMYQLRDEQTSSKWVHPVSGATAETTGLNGHNWLTAFSYDKKPLDDLREKMIAHGWWTGDFPHLPKVWNRSRGSWRLQRDTLRMRFGQFRDCNISAGRARVGLQRFILGRRTLQRMKSIRYYNADYTFSHWISKEDEKRLIALSAVEDYLVQRPSGPKKFGVRAKGFTASPKPSPTGISASDMRANVGIVEGDYNPGKVASVRARIAVWPFIGDTKAVNVRAGGRVWQPA